MHQIQEKRDLGSWPLFDQGQHAEVLNETRAYLDDDLPDDIVVRPRIVTLWALSAFTTGRELDEDLETWLDTWIDQTELPGFTVGEASLERISDAEDGNVAKFTITV